MVIKYTDSQLTDHFSIAEYTIHQTADTIPLTRNAIEHAQMLEEFRTWLGKPLTVSAWYRTAEYNKKVGGNSKSNHMRSTATDLTMTITEATFIKYAKKWKSICEKHGVIGEAGYYTGGWIHLGSFIDYSKTFYNWKTDSKGQHNMYFKI